MIKCLIFSDSHGAGLARMKRVIEAHADAEVVFFLGDGLRDIENFIYDKGKAFFAVRGNCDTSSLLGDVMCKKTDSINIEGRRIVFTHGDLYGVKYGLDGVIRLAEENSADILLFGHTHQPLEKYVPTENGGYYLFNPGSVGGGYGSKPSYGIINITDKGVILSHGSL